jgi:hypothetical protein
MPEIMEDKILDPGSFASRRHRANQAILSDILIFT